MTRYHRDPTKKDLYQQVTDSIIAALESGTPPWVRPWSKGHAGSKIPQNAVSGRPYSGINVLLTWANAESNAYPSMRYLTFLQAKEAGGNVRKGEHGTTVVFVKRLERTEDRDGNELGDNDRKSFTFLKSFTVFNVAQCDGLPDKIVHGGPAPAPRNHDARDPLADAFVASTGATIQEGGAEAYFAPGRDVIAMPAFNAFDNADAYYSTLFHEMTHWSGAKSRLDRDLAPRFDKDRYAAEELVAEIGASFLAAEFSIDATLRHASYLQHWIDVMKADKRAIFTAAAHAQKAADYLRGLALRESAPVPADELELAA